MGARPGIPAIDRAVALWYEAGTNARAKRTPDGPSRHPRRPLLHPRRRAGGANSKQGAVAGRSSRRVSCAHRSRQPRLERVCNLVPRAHAAGRGGSGARVAAGRGAGPASWRAVFHQRPGVDGRDPHDIRFNDERTVPAGAQRPRGGPDARGGRDAAWEDEHAGIRVARDHGQ